MAKYTPHQRQMFALAGQVSRGRPLKERLALFEAMLVESNARHIDYGDRDSQGILQQRPSTGWGPYIPGAKGAVTDMKQFLARARGQGKHYATAGQLAQGVQRSAFPDRYDARHDEALSALRHFGGGKVPKGAMSPAQPAMPVDAGGMNLGGGAQSGLSMEAFKSMAASTLLQRARERAAGREPAPGGLLALAQARRQVQAATDTYGLEPTTGSVVNPGRRGDKRIGGGLTELFYDPLGGIKHGQEIGAIGGHGNHVHIATRNARQMAAAIQKARSLGLRTSENPAVDDVDPVHTERSYHYRQFKGTKYGQALDVSGSPKSMAQYYRWAKRNLR